MLERTDTQIIATIGVRQGALSGEFTTRNTLEPERAITMHLVRGPSARSRGAGAHPHRAQRLPRGLHREFAFKNRLTAMLLEPLFAQTIGSLVDAFVQRARTRREQSPATKGCMVAWADARSSTCGTSAWPDACIADALTRRARRRRTPSPRTSPGTQPRSGSSAKRQRTDRFADGDRIELYRPLARDPRERRREQVARERRAARAARSAGTWRCRDALRGRWAARFPC